MLPHSATPTQNINFQIFSNLTVTRFNLAALCIFRLPSIVFTSRELYFVLSIQTLLSGLPRSDIYNFVTFMMRL